MSYKRWQKRKAKRIHKSMVECERFGDTVSLHKLHDRDWDFWWKEEWDHSIPNRSWKDTSKRKHQYKKTTNIVILPGYAVLYEDDAYIMPVEDILNRDRKIKIEDDHLYYLSECGWRVAFRIY